MGFRLKKIQIDKFRKFNSINFELGSRISVISGHNGVGKSNLLCLLASTCGTKKFKTILGKPFHPDFDDFFFISTEEIQEKYQIFIDVEFSKADCKPYLFSKRIGLKDDTAERNKVRLIPRTSNKNDTAKTLKETVEEIRTITNVGGDGRVPIPTSFLSLSRLYPLGETEVTSSVIGRRSQIYNTAANDKFKEWYNRVLPNSINPEESDMYSIEKNVTDSTSLNMKLDGTTLQAQSVGQDNLGNIISKLIDFYNISFSDDYVGGLLCIDEIDVSLHPNAQLNLLTLLNELSIELNLQIILTTHSLTIIKEILRLRKRQPEQYNLIYFKNSRNPFPDQLHSYRNIKADLFLEQNTVTPKLKIYFEDKVAKRLYQHLIDIVLQMDDIQLKKLPPHEIIAVDLGSSILKELIHKDDYFKNVLVILDGDAKYDSGSQPIMTDYLNSEPPKKNIKITPNLKFLPGEFSPEAYLFRIIYEYVENEHEHQAFWRSLDINIETNNFTPEYIRERLITPVIDELSPLENNTIKKTTSSLKRHSHLIFEFVEKSLILRDYFNDPMNFNILYDFTQDLEQSAEIMHKKRLSANY